MQDFYYRKLLVYQHAMMLLEDVYHLTKKFPSSELHGLTNQIQRAAVSIPSNIAEGMGRFSIKDRIRFIDISNGSVMEVMCQLEIAHRLGYISNEELQIQSFNNYYLKPYMLLYKYILLSLFNQFFNLCHDIQIHNLILHQNI